MKFYYTIILLLNIVFAFAQTPESTHYTTEDGLLDDEVFHVMQDKKGYIWISTNSGVNRFDACKFKSFDMSNGLPDNTILYSYEDYKGRIWFVSLSCKLSYFYNDSIYLYSYNNQLINSIKHRLPIKNGLYVDSLENVSFVTKYDKPLSIDSLGIVSYLLKSNCSIAFNINTANEIQYFTSHSLVDSLEIIEQGEKYNISFSDYDFEDKLNDYRKNRVNVSIFNGNIIFNINNVLFKINHDKTLKLKALNSDIIWLNNNENNIWVGTVKNGIYCYNSDFSKEIIYLLPDMSISSQCTDNNNGLWLTSLNNGVYYYPSTGINVYKQKDGLEENFTNKISITNSNEIYVGANKCVVNKFTPKGITKIVFNNADVLNDIFYDNKSSKLWVGTNRALVTIDKFNDKIIINDVSKNTVIAGVKSILKKKNNDFIFGETLGIVEYNEKTKKASYTRNSNNKYFNNRVNAIIEDKNNHIWVASTNGLWKKVSNYAKYDTQNKFLTSRIKELQYDSLHNSIIVGTKGLGIMIFNENKHFIDSTSDTYITEKQGLISNSIISTEKDNDTLWVGTNKGLSKIIFKNGNYKIYTIRNFTKQYGLPSNFINDIKTDSIFIYLATSNGFCIINKTVFSKKKKNPPIYFSGIKINEKDTSLLPEYHLSYDENNIQIKYIALDFLAQGNINYEYKMIGLKSNWQKTSANEITYRTLPPGKYKLVVKAHNVNGVCNNQAIELKIFIDKPFWEKWWFVILVISIIASIIYLIQNSIHRLKYKELEKRTEITKSLYSFKQQALSKQISPHFIFNSLNSIQNYILKNDRVASSEYLTKFATLMRKILSNSQHELIDFRDEIESLTLYMEMEANRFLNKFEFKIEILDKDIYNCKIPPLIIQPFVENAIWHGFKIIEKKGILNVSIQKNDDGIYCIIDDNGIGRKKSNENRSKIKESLGIKITENRLKIINELYNSNMEIEYIDKYDNNIPTGTTVIIKIPIIK